MATVNFPADTLNSTEFPHLQTSTISFRKILVPVDFSAPAGNALDAAAQIAELYGSEIVVVHASYPATYFVGEGVVATEFLGEQLDDEKKRVAELIASRPKLAKLHVETVVEYGNPVSLVRQLAEKHAPDLIVLGSHAASKLEQLALGSVAQSVVYALTTPVLIMGPAATIPVHLFQSILLASDLSTTCLRAAQYASSLRDQFGSNLTLLHVVDGAKPEDAAIRRSVESRIRKQLQMLVPENGHTSAPPYFRVEFGDPAEHILQIAESLDATLLVLGAQQGGMVADHLPWATLSKVVHSSTCGVLVIRGHLA